jgi:hypothetical protein
MARKPVLPADLDLDDLRTAQAPRRDHHSFMSGSNRRRHYPPAD